MRSENLGFESIRSAEGGDALENLGFQSRSRSGVIENRSELVCFMRIAEDIATKKSAEGGDALENLGFQSRSRSGVIENRSELVCFMRIAEDIATKKSAEGGVFRSSSFTRVGKRS